MKYIPLFLATSLSSALSLPANTSTIVDEETGTTTVITTVDKISSAELYLSGWQSNKSSTSDKWVIKGTRPKVSWAVTTEPEISKNISRTPGTPIKVLTDMKASVSVVGTGLTLTAKKYKEDYFPDSKYYSVATIGQVKIGQSGSWSTVHDGNENSIISGKNAEFIVKEGETIHFRARQNESINGSKIPGWRNESATGSADNGETIHIIPLVKGDKVPTTKASSSFLNSAASYLKPYLDQYGHIDIGEMDIIYLAELTHSNTSNRGYDTQDLIIHMSFTFLDQDSDD
ncbi:hypothetical protein [Rubritalea tangerina]|uniref:Uncharacterized protein n=1 Tax=Rubritalea tangerina TaxID=430798 RepID=A0ABW4ZDR7_9BACT